MPFLPMSTPLPLLSLSAFTLNSNSPLPLRTIFFSPHHLGIPNHMAFFLSLLLILTSSSANAAYWPPSPGYYPSSRFRSMSFYEGFRNLWGPEHQRMDNNALAIWLDRNSGIGYSHITTNIFLFFAKYSIFFGVCDVFLFFIHLFFWLILIVTGSGFKSVRPFRSGYFGASIKLQRGYTAGVITAFYVRN